MVVGISRLGSHDARWRRFGRRLYCLPAAGVAGDDERFCRGTRRAQLCSPVFGLG